MKRIISILLTVLIVIGLTGCGKQQESEVKTDDLLGAYDLDNTFFSKVKEIVLMGGVTEPLIINNKHLPELNFSCDAEASYRVFNSDCKVTVLNSHICLQALFGKREYDRLTQDDLPIYKYITDKTYKWFEFIMDEFDIEGFYNWDIVASVYITNPELFINNFVDINSTIEDLKTGLLVNTKNPNSNINMPTLITDVNEFNNIIFKTWGNI